MQRIKFRGYWLHHNNAAVAESMVRQIDDFPSFFTPSVDRPLIIDCGSNIGVSVLEWKFRWPTCQVICFEPDPNAFKVLHHNIEKNDAPSVRCVNAAVLDHEDGAVFFGDLSARGDARGNSTDPDWANRDGAQSTRVKSTRLGRHIAGRDVSFLKLDIEGSEQCVLMDIVDDLPRIEAIYVEVHETDASIDRNSAAAIQALLQQAGFTVEWEERFGDRSLPRHLDQWQAESGARQVQLLCWR